jgi:thiamine pyrophosphate-dependent acetolactate synthase large subunit-like protein
MVSAMAKQSHAALDRRTAVATLLNERGDLLVVAGLGSPSYDVHAAGDTDANYYLWGAMGAAALVGLGLAQARPDRKVLVITGDGEQLMGLGGLATMAVAKPKNLVVAVVDNGHFGETGMQESHTARGIDLAQVAAACGFVEARTISDMAGVEDARAALHRATDGPRFFLLKVKAENLPRSMPPRDAVHLKNRFRAHLGLPVN